MYTEILKISKKNIYASVSGQDSEFASDFMNFFLNRLSEDGREAFFDSAKEHSDYIDGLDEKIRSIEMLSSENIDEDFINAMMDVIEKDKFIALLACKFMTILDLYEGIKETDMIITNSSPCEIVGNLRGQESEVQNIANGNLPIKFVFSDGKTSFEVTEALEFKTNAPIEQIASIKNIVSKFVSVTKISREIIHKLISNYNATLSLS